MNIATDGTNVVLRRGNTAAGTDNENYYSTNGTSFTEGAALFRYPGVLSFANGYFFINGRQNNYSPAQFYGYSSDGGENWTNQSTTSEQPWYQSGSLSQVNDGSGMVWDGTNYYIAGYSYNSNAAAEISVSNGAVRDDGWVMTNLHGNYSGVFSLAATSDLVIAGGFSWTVGRRVRRRGLFGIRMTTVQTGHDSLYYQEQETSLRLAEAMIDCILRLTQLKFM